MRSLSFFSNRKSTGDEIFFSWCSSGGCRGIVVAECEGSTAEEGRVEGVELPEAVEEGAAGPEPWAEDAEGPEP
jgi:hypothetical protein